MKRAYIIDAESRVHIPIPAMEAAKLERGDLVHIDYSVSKGQLHLVLTPLVPATTQR